MKLDEVAVDAARHARPRHALWELSQRLGAQLNEPDSSGTSLGDEVRGLVLPTARLWALARRLSGEAKSDDSFFCSSEAGGLQLAGMLGKRKDRARLSVFVHNVDRPRARAALKAWGMSRSIDMFLACSQQQVAFLRSFLNLPSNRVRHVWDHTDTRFFTPGPASPGKKRPLIVSVGLEKRDYKTLAAATFDLDVDVRVSGFSKDASALASTFPTELPANMSRRYYDWPDLVQLYRDADIVVVSCFQNGYAAGVQTLMEAMACGRPVIATATRGLTGYLDSPVSSIPPSDPAQMRQAIQQALRDPSESEGRGAAGHRIAVGKYSMERYVEDIATDIDAPP